MRQVYTACSAKEAKLVLRNFEVDVLVSDIEMPEENGLSLCRWAKEQFQEIECIFLTTHADFAYAKEAIGKNLRPLYFFLLQSHFRLCQNGFYMIHFLLGCFAAGT